MLDILNGGVRLNTSENKTLFNGQYKVLGVLGQGGMGKVYKVEYLKLEIIRVVKEIDKKKIKNLDFMAEPNILKKLNHYNLPRIIDIEETKDYFYIIMDYIEGENLRSVLNQKRRFPENDVVKWAKELASALDYLHSQPIPIIYRDMKPENIMLCPDNSIKLIDFGISKPFDQINPKGKKGPLTARFAAPEQLESGYTDARSDIYSLGVTLYFLITGRRPDKGEKYHNIRAIDKNISEGLEYIIAKCTRENPEDRYESAAELLSDLRNIDKFSTAYKIQRNKRILKSAAYAASLVIFVSMSFYGYSTLLKETQQQYEQLISEGKILTSKKAFSEAEEKLEKAIAKKPKNKEGYIELANIYLKEGNLEKCQRYIKEEAMVAVPSLKDDGELNYVLGNAYYFNNQYKEALEYFEKAVREKPDNISYNRDLVATLVKLNKVDEAETLLKALKEKNIEEDTILYVQGEILRMKNQNKAAIEAFRKSIDNTSDTQLKQRLYISIAEIYRDKAKDFDNPVESEIAILEEAQDKLKDNNTTVALEMLGAAYNKKALLNKNNKAVFNDNINKSINCFQQLLDRGYKMSYVYRNIGLMYQYLNKFQESESYLIQARDTDPNDYRNYVQLSFLYADMENQKPIDQRNYNKTKENYNLAVKHAPNGENSVELNQLRNLISKLN